MTLMRATDLCSRDCLALAISSAKNDFGRFFYDVVKFPSVETFRNCSLHPSVCCHECVSVRLFEQSAEVTNPTHVRPTIIPPSYHVPGLPRVRRPKHIQITK